MRKEYDFSKGRRGAVLKAPPGKVRITIRIDEDIIECFRSRVHAAGGGNYQTLINSALREHIASRAEALEGKLRRVLREEFEDRDGRDRAAMDVIERAKDLLAEDRFKLRLHDLVMAQAKEAMTGFAEDQLTARGPRSKEEAAERLKSYEAIMSNLLKVQALLAYWGTESHRATLTLAPKQINDRSKPESESALRWYPGLLLLYAGGISAVAGGRYENLKVLMGAEISSAERSRAHLTLIRAVTSGLRAVQEAVKLLPEHERHYVPLSEYLFSLFSSILEDVLFLGSEYESHFDRFEVLLALQHAHEDSASRNGRAWGPIGRFGWKFQWGEDRSPLHLLMAEAEGAGNSWPPVKAGLFGASIDRFREVALEYRKGIASLGWS